MDEGGQLNRSSHLLKNSASHSPNWELGRILFAKRGFHDLASLRHGPCARFEIAALPTPLAVPLRQQFQA